MFSLEFKANVMVSGVVPSLSQYVQPCVCCSWGLWLLLNSSRCLLGFLFFPTLMFLRVFGLQSEEKTNRTPSWSVCLQCDYFRPFPHPSWGGRDPLAGQPSTFQLPFSFRLLCPPGQLTCITHSRSVLSSFLHPRGIQSSPYSSVFPLPVFTFVCKNHTIHTYSG